MNNQKLADKIIDLYDRQKFWRFDRLIKKNKDNEELFRIILDKSLFDVHETINEDIFQKLSIPIQKMCIESDIYSLGIASEEITNDKEYLKELQHKIDTKQVHSDSSFSVYDYIGDKLQRDKEFILSIIDTNPLQFVKSMDKIQYDEKTILDFFEKNPFYICELPDDLKYNYEYAASLIEKSAGTIVDAYVFFGKMDYDYLKNETIKNAFINTIGENEYEKILACSLANHIDVAKKIPPEEFRDLVKIMPHIFTDDEFAQHLFNFGNQKENVNLLNSINKLSKTTYKKISSPEDLSKLLFELSTSLNDGLTYENILNQVTQYWNEINVWISQIDDFYKDDYDNISVQADSRVFSNLYNLLIGIESNKLEDMFQIFYNNELRTSVYAKGIKNIEVTEDNLSFLQLACDSNVFNSSNEKIEMLNKLFLRVSKWNSDPYTSFEFIERLSTDNNLVNLLSNINIDTLDQDLLLNIFGYVNMGFNYVSKINSLDELRNYIEYVNNNIDKIEIVSLEEKKYYVLAKYFQIDDYSAQKIVHSFLNAKDDSSLYESMPEVKYLKNMLESIISAGSINELDNISAALDNNQTRITYKDIYDLLNKIKRTYGEEIKSTLLNVDEKTGVIDATDKDFNLLVHVIGAYGAAPVGNIYESWNTREKSSTVSICTSYISDNNMGIALTTEHSVILGFNNLPDDYLELMSSNDLWSRGFSASRESKFMNSNELKNNTRHGHNELVIRRRKGEYTEEKIQPSYIICFDNINDESKVAAEQFGVPIIFIDREKVAKRHHDEIVSMVEEFKQTLNPHLVSKIICEEENNKAGLKLTRPDLSEKYFGKEFRQSNINLIYSIIEKGIENNNSNAIAALNEFVKAIESEVEKGILKKETSERKNEFDIDYENMINILKSSPAYNESFELAPELTQEELYKRFLECRERLRISENEELSLINNNEISMNQSNDDKKVGL